MLRTGKILHWRIGLFTAAILVAPSMNAARAGDRETRDYTVFVDGKPAGAGHITIDRRDDGMTFVQCETDVKVRVFLFKYSYWYRGQEVWKNGKLQRLESSSNDDGKKFTVNAAAQNDRLRVSVNGTVRMMRGDAWPTSYWQLPDVKKRTGAISLLDADTGKELDARLENLGQQQVSIESRLQNTAHYRLTGKVTVDLWFDDNDRMVRQEWVEDGHRTLIVLAQVRK